MICFIFQLTYDNPPLSETSLQTAKRMDEVVRRRQEESLSVAVADVNKVVRTRRSRRGILSRLPT